MIYNPDPIITFVSVYYNWIIFGVGLFLILYAARRRFFPKHVDPLEFEDTE